MSRPSQFKRFLPPTLMVVILLTTAWYGMATLASSHSLALSGLVQAKEVKNASRFGGRILSIPVNEGQDVKSGDTLVVFDDTELQSKVDEAQAVLNQATAQKRLLARGADISDLRQARASLQEAKARVSQLSSGGLDEGIAQSRARLQKADGAYASARAQAEQADTLLNEGIISREKYDQLQSAYQTAKTEDDAAKTALSLAQSGSGGQFDVAKAELDAAQARYDQLRHGARPEDIDIALANVDKAKSELDALKAQMSEVQLKSPIAGTVSVVSATQGEFITPGRPVVSVIDYNNIWADVYVPEDKLDFIHIGQSVAVHAPAYSHADFDGRVAFINKKSEFIPNSGGTTSTSQGTFRVKVTIDNHDHTGKYQLLPGMKVNVAFSR